MTERKMGSPFTTYASIDGMPLTGGPQMVGAKDYVEMLFDGAWVACHPLSERHGWQETREYRLEASHPYYTQHAALDDAETLERLKASYPGLAWPELPDRAEVIVVGWEREWGEYEVPTWDTDTAEWIARKLIAEGVLK